MRAADGVGAVQQGHGAASPDWGTAELQRQAMRSPLISLPGQRQSLSLL